MAKIEFIKYSSRKSGTTEWLIEVDGEQIGEITKECEDFAHATSRARGTKVIGYSVAIDSDGYCRADKWFEANDNARAALKAAKHYAKQIIGGAA